MTQPTDKPSNGPADGPVIDQQALDNIRALRHVGAPDPLRKILSTYLNTTPALLTSLIEAVAAGDCQSVRQAAHSVKSSSASVGAVILSEVCRSLELQATANAIDGLEALSRQVQEEFEKAAIALRKELDR